MTTAARLVPVLVPGVRNPLVDPIIREGKLQSILSVTERADTILICQKQCKLCTIYSCPLQRQYDLTETTSDGSGVLN